MQRSRDKITEMKERARTTAAFSRKRQYKEPANRLTKIGLLAEKYFDCKGIEPWEFEEMLRNLVDVPKVKEILRQL